MLLDNFDGVAVHKNVQKSSSIIMSMELELFCELHGRAQSFLIWKKNQKDYVKLNYLRNNLQSRNRNIIYQYLLQTYWNVTATCPDLTYLLWWEETHTLPT